MAPGMFIVGVCALGGLIACSAFWWATRSGQFNNSDDAKYLVFDDEDEVPDRPTQPGAPGA